MKKFYLLFIVAASLLFSCGPSSKIKSSLPHTPLPTDAEVFVFNLDDKIPENGVFVGELKIGDSGFTTDCSYSTVIGKAKENARSMGGNVVKITEHKAPNFGSTCHRIKANVYLASSEDVNAARPVMTIDDSLLKENCAILYFYRSKGSMGIAVNYDVKIYDEVVWRASNNSKEWIKVQANGQMRISAKTEVENQLIIDVQPGRHYYIRFGVDMGLMVGRPILELMDETAGKRGFNEIKD